MSRSPRSKARRAAARIRKAERRTRLRLLPPPNPEAPDEIGDVVDEIAAPGWPEIERRRRPRLRRHHESRVDWKHVAIYAPVLILVVLVGASALWSFFEKETLTPRPQPLPRVTVVTANPSSPLAAAWVTALSHAALQTTLVPLEKFDDASGVVVLCDVPYLWRPAADTLRAFVRRGGSIVIAGMPPAGEVGELRFTAERGIADPALKLGESPSPLLARLNPGEEIPARRVPVVFLKETPRMSVDARWSSNARAAIMHVQQHGARYIWFGFDPTVLAANNILSPLLRTSFRWVAGQPISEGAAGSDDVAANLTPDARRNARADHLLFSVDPAGGDAFAVRMTNGGNAAIPHPTVKIWLPPRVTRVAVAGDLMMRAGVTLTAADEGSCLVTLPLLGPHGERVLKLKTVESGPSGPQSPRL